MDNVPARCLCMVALLFLTVCLPMTAGGCGNRTDPVKTGVVEIEDSFTNPGSAGLVDSGMQQLLSELAMDAGLTTCEGASLSREVGALVEEGDSLVIITGRGDQVLDTAADGAGTTIAGLGMNLKNSRGEKLTAASGVTCVRYKVEEGAYLSGVLAAGMTVARGHPWINPDAVVGFIGCLQDPFEMAYLKGFEAGVAAVNPNCAVAEYDIPNNRDIDNTRASVEAAIKLKADIIFCVPGSFSREVLAMGSARGFLAITSDADGSEAAPDSLLAGTVLRDDLAMFRAAQEFLKERLPAGPVEWGMLEGIVDFSINMDLYKYISASIDQSLKQAVPLNLYTP